MRFLHTSDWHLGRMLHGVSLVEDQAHALDELVALARDARPDAVLLAGDVFDRAVPPAEAIELFDDVLCRLVLGQGLKVVAIAGNHDSPKRLAFGARLLAASGFTVVGEPRAGAAPLVLEDRFGAVEIHGLPYAEPAVVRLRLGAEVHDHDGALRAQIAALPREPGRRAVVLAHAFVAGCEECESERPLTVGGAGTVGGDAFAGFAYAALGHLHRPQNVDGGRARYGGSLLKYSFSECTHTKSASLVEIDAGGRCEVETVPLTVRRDLRRLRGRMKQLLAGPRCDDFLLIELEDEGALLDPMGRLREVYPNLLRIERPFYVPGAPLGAGERGAIGRNHAGLFDDFFEQVTGSPIGEAERAAFEAVYARWLEAEREAGA